jgi:hypothetical protein
LETFVQKSETFLQKQNIITKNCLPLFNLKEKQLQSVCGVHRKQKSVKQKRDFQSIQIEAHCLRINSRVSSTKIKKSEPLSQYNSAAIVTDNDQNKNMVAADEVEMMKTCPDFRKKDKGKDNHNGRSVASWERKKKTT